MDPEQRLPMDGNTYSWQTLAPGQELRLRTNSPVHKGSYSSHVQSVEDGQIRVAVPLEQGRLVLIPVGTIVGLEVDTPEGRLELAGRVVDRVGGPGRCLVVAPVRATEEPRQAVVAQRRSQVIAVTSGKGGVGKTTLVVNLAIALTAMDRRVCMIDADLGTANIDVLLNLTPRYNLAHVLSGEKNIYEVVIEGPGGVVILPGGSGLQELTSLDDRQLARLIAQFQHLERYTDVILIDTGSGLSRSVTNFVAAADEAIVVTVPEPHAITDAYALVKVLAQQAEELSMRLVVNRVTSEHEARDIAQKMTFASRRFLGVELTYLGYVLEDAMVGRSIRKQVDFISAYPKSRAAECVRTVAGSLIGAEVPAGPMAPMGGFLGRLRALLPKAGV